jgi:phage terminase Nu1 subunit (DNA packaging protein)
VNVVKGEVLNRAELAKFFGVALTTVDAWVREDCPFVKKAQGKGQSWKFDSAAVAEWLQERAVNNKVGDIASINLDEAGRRKLAAQASMEELKLRKMQGDLVETSAVIQAGVDSYTACRARLLSIPTKLAPRLIGCQKPEEAKALLEGEIYQALEELGNYEASEDGQPSTTQPDCHLAKSATAATETDSQ